MTNKLTKEIEDDLDENRILFKWMIKNYGKRCPDFEERCACCVAWNLYDRLIQKEDLIKNGEKETFEEHIKHCGCCDDGENKK